MEINHNNDEWIYFSSEYSWLKEHQKEGTIFKTFEEFWYNFAKRSYIISDAKIENEKFKAQLKTNALEIYNTFTKGLKNA